MRSFRSLVFLLATLAAWPSLARGQKTTATTPPQSPAVLHQVGLALVASSAYLQAQMAKGPPPGLVQFDVRSLTRLIKDSAAAVGPLMTQAMGVSLADTMRLATCKPVHSAACELGSAQAVLEVSSAAVKGTHATIEIRRYQQGSSGGSAGTLSSTLLRFTLVLVGAGWQVTKYGTASG